MRDPRSLTNQALGQIKMWTSLKTSSVLAKFEDVEFCQKSFLLTFSKNWMINFELLKKWLKKVDQQNLTHADQESAPWASENEDGELRQNFLRCATRRYVEKVLLRCRVPGRRQREDEETGRERAANVVRVVRPSTVAPCPFHL